MWSKTNWSKGKSGKGKNKSSGWGNQDSAWDQGGWGKGSYPSDSADWSASGSSAAGKGWGGWTGDGKATSQEFEHGNQGKGKQYVPRLEGRYALAKTALRPYADEKGSAVYAQGSPKDFFDKTNMRQIIDSRNSELVRRPAVGMSTVSSSVLSMLTHLDGRDGDNERSLRTALEELSDIFAGEDGASLKRACETLAKDRTARASPDKLRKAVEAWLGFFRKHKEALQRLLPQLLAGASVLYLGGMQILEATTLVNALSNWSTKVPLTVNNENTLKSWQASPKALSLLVAYIVEAFGQRHADDSAWKRAHGGWGGDSDDDEPGQDAPWGVAEKEKRKAPSSSSSSSSSRRRRKKAKKAAKKASKNAGKATEKVAKKAEEAGKDGNKAAEEAAKKAEEGEMEAEMPQGEGLSQRSLEDPLE